MNVAAISNYSITHGNSYTAAPKYKPVKPVKMEKLPTEQDARRARNQKSYIVGMSILSAASLLLSTKGKTGLNIRA